MGIAEETVVRLRRDYPGLSVVARAPAQGGPWLRLKRWWLSLRARWLSRKTRQLTPGPVLAVKVWVDGIRGGRSKVRCRYQLIIDTSHLQQAIPDVWVISPPDREIKHVNIWPSHKSFCKWSGTRLPSICWYTYANGWLAAPAKSRTLGAALEYIKQLLNTENHDSPAR